MKRILSAAMAALIALALFALPTSAADTTAYAAEILRLVNEERAKAGLAELKGGPGALDAAAGLRAQEIAVTFSHTRPNGTSCFTALAEHGVAYAACGENIASGQATPAEVMAGWMNSPGHRANILGNYNRLGLGVREINGRIHWAQMFILERGSTATTTRAAAATRANPASTATTTTTAAGLSEKIAAALPDWLQWVLRVFFFGWIWMK